MANRELNKLLGILFWNSHLLLMFQLVYILNNDCVVSVFLIVFYVSLIHYNFCRGY